MNTICRTAWRFQPLICQIGCQLVIYFGRTSAATSSRWVYNQSASKAFQWNSRYGHTVLQYILLCCTYCMSPALHEWNSSLQHLQWIATGRSLHALTWLWHAAMVSDCPCGIWGSVPHARRVQEAGGDAQLLGFLQPKAMLGLKSFGERCLGCFHLFPVLICFFMFFFFILVCCLRSGWSEYHGLWRTLTSQCQCCIMYLEHSDCEIGKQSQFAFSFLKIAMWS